MSVLARRFTALVTVAALAGLAAPASAQLGRGGGLGQGAIPGGSAGGSSKKKAPAKKPEEESHAAPSPEAAQALQTAEPQLPQDPLEVPDEVKKRIGTDWDRDPERGLDVKTERDWYGLYYQEKSGSYRFRTLFPLWAERMLPADRASLYGPYYNRRSKNVDTDMLFPLFFKSRVGITKTTIVGPFMHSEQPKGLVRNQGLFPGDPGYVPLEEPARHDNWLFPLFFEGSAADGSGYFHVPPLLTYTSHTAQNGLNIVGPMYCKWKGGPTCDPRTTDSIDLGLAPLYFYGRNDAREYEVIPPLLHYYRYTELGDKTFNLWGPLLMERSPDKQVVDLFPLFYRNWGKNESSTTLVPLFHYSYKGTSNLLVTPLFVKAHGESGDDTFATWLYARYRGRTELDMYTPFYWQYRDPDIGLDRKLLFPFFYKNTSPRSNDLAIFPFYGHFEKPGLKEQTWITPFFRHETSVTGWETDIFPIFYSGRQNQSSHLVVAPFFWDFTSPSSRVTVGAPLYFRYADEKSITQVAFNTFYREKKVEGGSDWEFHFFPLFSYGQSPTSQWWNLLYGLAGYAHEGTSSRMKLLYVPIKLSD